jgi:CO/xanthine dehydrogenase Mo-binding subunit
LVGWGMAAGLWVQAPITAGIALSTNGHAEGACATSDTGTGAYTSMAQVAADMLAYRSTISVTHLTTPLSCNRRLTADQG